MQYLTEDGKLYRTEKCDVRAEVSLRFYGKGVGCAARIAKQAFEPITLQSLRRASSGLTPVIWSQK